MANIEAGNEAQLMIRSLVESYGLTLGTKKGHNIICAISTLEAIYEKHGYHGLSRVLQLIIGAWEGDLNSFSANILNAVARLITIYGDTLDDEIFIDRLGSISVKQLTRNAKDRRPGSMGYAEVMVIEYNGKRKNGSRLPLSMLDMRESTLIKALEEIPDDMIQDEDQDYLERDFYYDGEEDDL